MSALFNYLDSFQMILMLNAIIALGYIFAWRKVFNIDDCYGILRVVRIVSFPAFMFREIAMSDFSYFTWKSLIVSFLTLLSIRILTIFPALIFPGKGRFLRYLQLVFSYSYSSFYAFGYPIIRLFFGVEYEYIVVIVSIVNSLILRPIDVILINTVSPKAPLDQNVDVPLDDQNGEVPLDQDNENQLEDIEPSQGESLTEYLVKETNIESVLPENYIFHDEGSLKKRLALAIFSSQNLLMFLGLSFSLTKWDLPIVVDTVVNEFEKFIVGCTLFFTGVAMWSHPFKGCNWLQVIPCLIMKHVVTPLLAALFCWLLKFDNLTAQACTFLFSTPVDYTGIALLSKANLKPNPITYTFFYSQIISIPCFLLWVVVFNEAKLFN
ncbi:Auxin Efflux Carrier family protein [Tritrichomonas foetus]|uniref:Auxin Efflux Carrier family protein n=1 Tax=Tritrichomonas foetus TaxID=1144522 RepID=A0A1J4KY60_9EUKA|nr:Auxin Efflux Carrier family protein [Tritrichomonas foetus]|eukprot:OHT15824.1 Auxin Efflux Carrier family protein [Tritrichomonas foetus]